jgi:hypothetical protein
MDDCSKRSTVDNGGFHHRAHSSIFHAPFAIHRCMVSSTMIFFLHNQTLLHLVIAMIDAEPTSPIFSQFGVFRKNNKAMPQQPWISLSDYDKALGTGDILYGGNSVSGLQTMILNSHNGANVFIRKNS